MARLVSLSVLIAAIAGLGIMFFQVIAPFLLPLFLAAVAAVILTPSFEDIRRRLKGRTRTAAGVTTVLVMLLVLVPLTGAIVVAAAQAYSFSLKVSPSEISALRSRLVDSAAGWAAEHESWLPTGIRLPGEPEVAVIDRRIKEIDEQLAGLEASSESPVEVDSDAATESDSDAVADDDAIANSSGALFTDPMVETELRRERAEVVALREKYAAFIASDADRVREYRRRIQGWVNETRQSLDGQLFGVASKTVGGTLGILGQSFGVFVGATITFFIFIVALYYFLADGPTLIEGTYRLIPVQQGYQRELMQEFGKVVRSVVLATFLAATAQGVATTLALGLCGFDHLILLLILAIIASLIPLAGTWLVWVPCALILIAKGNYVAACLLAAWGSVVVGTMDNVIRAYVLNSDTKLHPLLALIAVLGGLQVMGIWGVFIGPIVASCLHALVKIFNHELQELSQEKFGPLLRRDSSESVERSQIAPSGRPKPPTVGGDTEKPGKTDSKSAKPASPDERGSSSALASADEAKPDQSAS